MLTIKRTASLLAVFLITGFLASCQDSPVSTEDVINLPSEKVSIESPEYQSDVQQESANFGVDITLENNSVTDRNSDAAPNDHANPVARANSVARKYLRILQSLELSEEQWVRIRHCFADYKECIESATARYRHARQELHQEFRAKVARIKAALENGDITPERARELYKECVEEYRAQTKRLAAAYHEAIANCLHNLKECIESVLNERQLARWRELLGGSDGGDDEGGRGTGTRG
ncbi:MAG: hypothetical protein AB7H80_11440 [Candidatus Kapaibacterium sp.]